MKKIIKILIKYLLIWKSYLIVVINKIKIAEVPIFYGIPCIKNKGIIEISRNVILRSGYRYNLSGLKGGGTIVMVEKGAILKIGANSGISNTTIYVKKSIAIGDNVLIGCDCKIYDSDFHSKHFEKRRQIPEVYDEDEGVRIGDHVFIGTGSIILKGSIIGCHSVIGAGSLVSGVIPPNEIWAGNPAKKIGIVS